MCNTYVITAWDQAPQWGEKTKKSASEASEEVWGGMRITKLRYIPPPQSTTRLASFADFLPVSSVLCLFPRYGAWSQVNVIMVLQ